VRPISLAALLLCLLPLGACGGGSDEPDRASSEARAADSGAREPQRFFKPGGIWNRPLRRDEQVDRRSATYAGELNRQVRRGGPWIATTSFSAPIYTVPRRQPRVRVRLKNRYPPLERALRRVPIPPGARPAAGTDRHIVVWQPSTDTMWELWTARREGRGWRAGWGARMTRVSRRSGAFPNPTGATASGLPLVGGMIRAFELRRGRIDHALAIAAPVARRGRYVPPATRTDGQSSDSRSIPMGTRFRIDPSLDVRALRLPRAAEAIALAAQRYGMILRDKTGGSVNFYAEAPREGNRNPYPDLFKGYPNNILRRFPWDRLQVVAPRSTR